MLAPACGIAVAARAAALANAYTVYETAVANAEAGRTPQVALAYASYETNQAGALTVYAAHGPDSNRRWRKNPVAGHHRPELFGVPLKEGCARLLPPVGRDKAAFPFSGR